VLDNGVMWLAIQKVCEMWIEFLRPVPVSDILKSHVYAGLLELEVVAASLFAGY